MAKWEYSACGRIREARCKPKKCRECGEKETFAKKPGEAETVTAKKAAGKAGKQPGADNRR